MSRSAFGLVLDRGAAGCRAPGCFGGIRNAPPLNMQALRPTAKVALTWLRCFLSLSALKQDYTLFLFRAPVFISATEIARDLPPEARSAH